MSVDRSTTVIFVGGLGPQIGGETQKNRDIVAWMRARSVRLLAINTAVWRRKPIRVFARVMPAMFLARVPLIISVDVGSLLRVLRFARALEWNKKRHIAILAIGGHLGQRLSRLPDEIRAKRIGELQDCDVVVVEAVGLAAELRELGLSNVLHLPNFRMGLPVDHSDAERRFLEPGPLRTVFLSRVIKEKGVLEAILAVKRANELAAGEASVSLDIYGPIDPDFRTEFSSAIGACSGAKYCGIVEPGEAQEVLLRYQVMLLPTFYKGEGMPGVLIESFFAGLPVIATDWRFNSEIIHDGVEGWLVPIRTVESMAQRLVTAMTRRETLVAASRACIDAAGAYTADVVLGRLVSKLEGCGWRLTNESKL